MTTVNLKTALSGQTTIPNGFTFNYATRYIIDDNFTLAANTSAGTSSLCILEFQGGSIVWMVRLFVRGITSVCRKVYISVKERKYMFVDSVEWSL